MSLAIAPFCLRSQIHGVLKHTDVHSFLYSLVSGFSVSNRCWICVQSLVIFSDAFWKIRHKGNKYRPVSTVHKSSTIGHSSFVIPQASYRSSSSIFIAEICGWALWQHPLHLLHGPTFRSRMSQPIFPRTVAWIVVSDLCCLYLVPGLWCNMN